MPKSARPRRLCPTCRKVGVPRRSVYPPEDICPFCGMTYDRLGPTERNGLKLALIGLIGLGLCFVLVFAIVGPAATGWIFVLAVIGVFLSGFLLLWWVRDTIRETGWLGPFLWIVLIPCLTVPATMVLQDELLGAADYAWERCTPSPDDSGYECEADRVAVTLLPGVLNLLAFAWVRSSESRTRAAATVAGTLGAVRLVVPLGMTELSAGSVLFRADPYDFSYLFPTASAAVSFYLWLASLVVFCLFGLFTTDHANA